MQCIALYFQNNFLQTPSKAFKLTKLRFSQKGGDSRKQSVKKISGFCNSDQPSTTRMLLFNRQRKSLEKV